MHAALYCFLLARQINHHQAAAYVRCPACLSIWLCDSDRQPVWQCTIVCNCSHAVLAAYYVHPMASYHGGLTYQLTDWRTPHPRLGLNAILGSLSVIRLLASSFHCWSSIIGVVASELIPLGSQPSEDQPGGNHRHDACMIFFIFTDTR